MNIYILIVIGIIGLVFGSFYNVVILRFLSNESIVLPASKCPKCNHKLYFWHNIPVLSYIILRGKCYFCKEKISIQYPIIELTTMLLFIALYLKYGLTVESALYAIILSGLLIMTVTDLKEKIADCRITIIMAIFGILYNWLFAHSIIPSVIGLIVGAGIIEAIAHIGKLTVGTRAMGEADTYVAGALGACFGFYALPAILLYSVISYGFIILPLFLYKQYLAGNKVICITMIAFLLMSLVCKLITQNIFILCLLIIIGCLLVYLIMKGLRDKSSPKTYLPYIPAFLLSTLYFLFI